MAHTASLTLNPICYARAPLRGPADRDPGGRGRGDGPRLRGAECPLTPRPKLTGTTEIKGKLEGFFILVSGHIRIHTCVLFLSLHVLSTGIPVSFTRCVLESWLATPRQKDLLCRGAYQLEPLHW